MRELFLFQDNLSITEQVTTKFKKDLIKKFPYDVKNIEIIYANRNTALTIKVKSHSDKDVVILKIGNYMVDNFRTYQTKDTINVKKTQDLEFVHLIMSYAKQLSLLFKEFKGERA